jgi:hypothetical protein
MPSAEIGSVIFTLSFAWSATIWNIPVVAKV